MAYSLNYNAGLGIIELTLQGEYTLQGVCDGTRDALRMGVEKGTDLYLRDYRQAKVRVGTVDIQQLPEALNEIYTEYGVDIHTAKRAFVVDDMKDDFLFFETVAVNRGQLVRVFTDIDEARSWLLGTGGPKD